MTSSLSSSSFSSSACSATLSSQERRILRLLLAQESNIVDQCNACLSKFSSMMHDLQCMRHDHDLDEHTLKCDEFIRTHASLDCDVSGCEMVPGAVQTAMTCDCICVQAACFRILYKWTPQLDMLRMKLLKIKNMCSAHVLKSGIVTCGSETRGSETRGSETRGSETCDNIEKTVKKILKLQTAPH